MKHRVITFAFAVCLVSSLAFADNPTDAPLVTNDGTTPVVQQETRVSHKRQHAKKKDKSLAKTKTENPPQEDSQKQQNTSEYPATGNN
jgi:hypothetical protein